MDNKFKKYFQFFLIVLAAGAIYPIIYLKTNYQVTLLQVFNMSLPQLNSIYSVLGIVWVILTFWLLRQISKKKASILGTTKDVIPEL